jgi:hypothetical protein
MIDISKFYDDAIPTYGNSDATYSAGTPTTTVAPQKFDLETLVRIVKELEKERIFYILKNGHSLFIATEKPTLMLSKYVDANMAYIITDFGIVAGMDIYEQIAALNLDLQWTTNTSKSQNYKLDNEKYND